PEQRAGELRNVSSTHLLGGVAEPLLPFNADWDVSDCGTAWASIASLRGGHDRSRAAGAAHARGRCAGGGRRAGADRGRRLAAGRGGARAIPPAARIG